MFGHDNQNNNQSNDQNNGQHDGGNNSDIQPHVQTDDNQFAAPASAPVTTDNPVVQHPAPASSAAPASATDDLLDIKHQALQALTPLVDQLEQTPEEQFRTTMMMIQASDDHELIKVAYDAAQKIGNEKERAQALLDIVNEINYFTQQS